MIDGTRARLWGPRAAARDLIPGRCEVDYHEQREGDHGG